MIVRLSCQVDTVRPGCLSTRPYQQRPLINKTLSKDTFYQRGLTVGKPGPGMRCCKFNSTSNVLVCETLRKVYMYGCVSEWVGSVCVCVVLSLLDSSNMLPLFRITPLRVVVLPLLPFPPSPVIVFFIMFAHCTSKSQVSWDFKKNFQKNKK
jgi:hypothetical protein